MQNLILWRYYGNTLIHINAMGQIQLGSRTSVSQTWMTKKFRPHPIIMKAV